MNKFLGLLVVFLFSVLSVHSADMRFVQVDGVLLNSNNTQPFEALVEKINEEKNVEFVVFTGNNISSPKKENLEAFISVAKKLNRPYYMVLGQKDVNLQKEFGKKEYVKLLKKKVRTHKKYEMPNYVFKKKNIVFIVADGSKEVIPTAMGYYRDDVILWLDEQLDEYADKNVVILQHYPIVPPAKRETHYTYRAEDYLKLLSEHKNVKAVVAGHFGVNNEQTYNGILHIATQNSPTYRIIDILDYETSNPTFWSTIKE